MTPPRPHSAAAPELRTLAAAPPGGGPGSICVELTRSPHNPATRETREPLASRQPRDPGLYAASPYQCTVPRRSRLTLALADTRRATVVSRGVSFLIKPQAGVGQVCTPWKRVNSNLPQRCMVGVMGQSPPELLIAQSKSKLPVDISPSSASRCAILGRHGPQHTFPAALSAICCCTHPSHDPSDALPLALPPHGTRKLMARPAGLLVQHPALSRTNTLPLSMQGSSMDEDDGRTKSTPRGNNLQVGIVLSRG